MGGTAHLASHISVRGFRPYSLLPSIVNDTYARVLPVRTSFTFRWHRARAPWEKRGARVIGRVRDGALLGEERDSALAGLCFYLAIIRFIRN